MGPPVEGLVVTTGLTLVVANVFNLSSIALTGSAAFLIVFAAVNVAAARLATRRGSRVLAGAAAVACAASLAALVVEEWSPHSSGVVSVAAMVAGSFGIEAAYRRVTRRRIRAHLAPPPGRDPPGPTPAPGAEGAGRPGVSPGRRRARRGGSRS